MFLNLFTFPAYAASYKPFCAKSLPFNIDAPAAYKPFYAISDPSDAAYKPFYVKSLPADAATFKPFYTKSLPADNVTPAT